jgi:hypothetical protein
MKEVLKWLVGWLVYPLILLRKPGASLEYQQACAAIRVWLFSKPNGDRRRAVHNATSPEREPTRGW